MTEFIVDFTVILDAENEEEAKDKAVKYFSLKKVRRNHIVNVETNE